MSNRKPPQRDAATHTQTTNRAPRKPRPAPEPQVTITTVGRIGWRALTTARLIALGYPEAEAVERVRRVAARYAAEGIDPDAEAEAARQKGGGNDE